MMKHLPLFLMLASLAMICFCAGCIGTPNVSDNETISVTDAVGRTVILPADPQKIAVSGSGSTRLIVYLGALDRVVAVDSQDGKSVQSTDLRPYGLANPGLRDLPTLGTSKGQIDPERLLAAAPDLILKSTSGSDLATEADQITEKTGIPVVLYAQYDPGTKPDEFAANLRLLGTVLGKGQRVEEILQYFAEIEQDLNSRTKNISDAGKPVPYIGGVAYSGSHGFYST